MKFPFIILICTSVTFAFAHQSSSQFIPEASGICRVNDNMVVAGDEEPTALWVQAINGKLEKVKVQGAAWDDLEGLATVDGTRFFATTSHSRTKKGKRKPEREQLMLMSLSQRNIETLQSWNLRESILAQLEKSHGQVLDMKTVEAAPAEEGGLNIEGLAYRGGELFLGLRSPITSKGEALIVVIKNADALLTGAAPIFGGVLTLRLGDKGIRSLDTVTSGLLVLSGSTDDTDQAFGLDQLTLDSGTLQSFKLDGFEDLLRPEGVLSEKDGSVTLVQDFKEPQSQDIIVRLLRN